MESFLNTLRGRKKDMDKVDYVPPQVDYAPPQTALVQRRPVEAEVKAVLAEFADLRAERDRAYKEYSQIKGDHDRAMALVTQAKEHITGLQEHNADLKRRCAEYQSERDLAVAKFAKLESLLTSIRAQLDVHGIVPDPYVREPVAPDAEAPETSSPLPPPPKRATPPDMEEMLARLARNGGPQ